MKKIKSIIETAGKLLGEFFGLLMAFIVFTVSPYFLRLMDPTAGAYDAGVLQILVFSVVATLLFSFLSWIGLRINFMEFFNYLQTDLKDDFKTLDKWQKIKISLFVYFGYLLVFVLTARIL